MTTVFDLEKLATMVAEKVTNNSTKSSPPLDEYMHKWFMIKRRTISPKTYNDYYDLYCHHVTPYFKNCPLNEITSAILEEFYLYLLDSIRLSNATVNKIKSSVLGAALRKAYGQKIIDHNPTVGIEPINDNSQHHEPYTGDELNRLAIASQCSYQWIALPILIGTGLRRCELLGLRWDDFDSANRTLHVQRDLVSTSNATYITGTKTHSSKRLVVIPQELCDALLKYKNQEGANKTYIVSQIKNDKPMEPHNFSKMYRHWCKKANIPESKWGGHSTRATYCTMASESSDSLDNLDGLRRQVGHTDFRMLLNVYIHDRTHKKQYDIVDQMSPCLKSFFSACTPAA